MQFADFLYRKKEEVTKIMITPPHVYNVFTTKTMKEIARHLHDVEFDFTAGSSEKKGEGNLVPMLPVYGSGGTRDGFGKQGSIPGKAKS